MSGLAPLAGLSPAGFHVFIACGTGDQPFRTGWRLRPGMLSALTCLVPCRLAVLVCVNVVCIFVRVVTPTIAGWFAELSVLHHFLFRSPAVLTPPAWAREFQSGLRVSVPSFVSDLRWGG